MPELPRIDLSQLADIDPLASKTTQQERDMLLAGAGIVTADKVIGSPFGLRQDIADNLRASGVTASAPELRRELIHQRDFYADQIEKGLL